MVQLRFLVPRLSIIRETLLLFVGYIYRYRYLNNTLNVNRPEAMISISS